MAGNRIWGEGKKVPTGRSEKNVIEKTQKVLSTKRKSWREGSDAGECPQLTMGKKKNEGGGADRGSWN